jgi:DNA mismatch endonuclease (patch repair protein)
MADIKSPEERSRNMAAIRSKDTKPEVYLRKLLFAEGYRYRKNYAKIPGHPDIYLPKYKTAIFVHGCFWHRHQGCKYAHMPKSNVEFWKSKFSKNILRDQKVKENLQNENIKELVIWECTIMKMIRDDGYRSLILDECVRFMRSKEQRYDEL